MVLAELIELFEKLVESGKIMNLPNIPSKTMGGKVFWNELAECKGWRLQKNMITHHCRILDPENVRRAWGGDDAMEQLFQKLNK